VGELPEPPTDQVALHRALKQFEGPRQYVSHAEGLTYSVISETVVDSTTAAGRRKVAPVTLFTASMDATGAVSIDPPEMHDELVDVVEAGFVRAKGELEPADLSAWFISRAKKSQAISLRDTGGIYFVPAQGHADWTRFGEVIKSVSSHRIFEIPAVKNDKAVEAILDALKSEAQQQIEQIEEALDEDKLGVRALRSRAERCLDMEKKLTSYERLLDVSAEDIRESLEALQARIVSASIVAEGRK